MDLQTFKQGTRLHPGWEHGEEEGYMMSNTKPALINYTLETFANERDMHWHLSQWEKRKAEYYPKLKAAGLKKMTGTKVWNNKGEAALGWIFEYEDAKSFKKCQEIFAAIAREEAEEVPVIRQAFRGIVFDEEIL